MDLLFDHKKPDLYRVELGFIILVRGIFRGFPFPVQHRRELIEQLLMPLRKAINSYV
jgi:hypothetical protein